MTNYEKIKQMSIDEMVQGDITLLGCVGHVPMEYCNKFHGNCIDCKKELSGVCEAISEV